MKRRMNVMLLCLALSPALFAQGFQFAPLDVPGARLTRPFGVNARGQVVGVYQDSNKVSHGFLRDLDGSYKQIDGPDATFTNATGINARGDIVGRWSDANGNHGYLLPHNAEFIDLHLPCFSSSTNSSVPHGINDLGDIVGRCFDADWKEHGFVRNHLDGTFTMLDFPDAVTTDAWLITDANVAATAPPVPVIVGDYSDATGYVHGYLWTPAAGFTTLDVPDNQTGLRARNQRGDITGIYGTSEDGTRIHGFLLRDGIFITVDFPGSVDNPPQGGTLVINDRGLIVGGYIDVAKREHGFMAIACPASGCQ